MSKNPGNTGRDAEEPRSPKSPPDKTSNLLAVGGGLFLVASFVALFVLVLTLVKSEKTPPFSAFASAFQDAAAAGTLPYMVFDYYATAYAIPLLLFFAVIVSTIIGYGLLRASGRASRRTIPPQDYGLVQQLLLEKNVTGIDQYIRLNSLRGFMGVFTRIGLTGLPLNRQSR